MASLNSAYAQVDRSFEHLSELKLLHDEVCSEHAKRTIIQFENVETKQTGNVFELNRTVPAGQTVKFGQIVCPQVPVAIRIRIIAGETANCLRFALDYLVAQLAILKTRVRPERPQFPITESPEKFKEGRRSGLVGVDDAHIAEIERLQPYKGCDWTRMLAILTNFYKHNDLILLRHGVLVATEKISADATEDDPFPYKMRVDVKNALHIALNEGFPLINTLEVLQSEVSHTLDKFKPLFH